MTNEDEDQRLQATALQNAGTILLARRRAEEELLRAKAEIEQKAAALAEDARILEVLNKTGASLSANLEIGSLLQSVTDAATQVSGAEFGAFFYNAAAPSGDSYMLYALSGAPREAFEQFGQPRATPLFGPTFRGEGVVRLDDVLQDPRYGAESPHFGMPKGHLPVRSYLAVPVVSRSGEVIGGLFFGHSRTAVFTEKSERLVAGIAGQAAIAIDNARLFAERNSLLESERAARSQAEHASALKDEFLAILSHELRTPLSAILGWAQILRRRSDEKTLKQGVDTIERNARIQTQLIEDLLDMNRITAGKIRLDIHPLVPSTFIDAAIETVRLAADAKNIRVQTEIDPAAGPITGDPNRLQQVIWNLLSNAIKFTPNGGSVRVTLAQMGSHIVIMVTDSGVGIEPEFIGHVFERFRQANASTTRTEGGLGLGLSIVKNLVEVHGGTVSVASPGKNAGTTVTIRLPLAAGTQPAHSGLRAHTAAARTEPQDFQPLDLRDLKILIVDDEPDAREHIRRVLEECGASVTSASSAREALAIVREQPLQILISDIGMPETDGYELIRRVRALEQSGKRSIPAIALTAFARSEDRTRALRAGYSVHLSKPVEPAELIATVASVAGRMTEADPSLGSR